MPAIIFLGVSVSLMISLTTVILGLTFSFDTVFAQRATPEPAVGRATPVPPAPTQIAIVIQEFVSVGEISGNGGLDSMTEAIAIEDSTSTIDPITVGDQADVKIGEFPIGQQTKSSDKNQGAAARAKKHSSDAFSRGTGSVKENGEGSDDGSLGEAGSAGSAWMVVVYVVIGLVAIALLGLLGRRLLGARRAS